MAPDNRINPLLPIWPTAPLKEFEGNLRERRRVQTEKKTGGRKGREKSDEDGKLHIDTYA